MPPLKDPRKGDPSRAAMMDSERDNRRDAAAGEPMSDTRGASSWVVAPKKGYESTAAFFTRVL